MKRRRNKINLITVPCKKCGKPVTTLERPIWATREMQNKYAGICSDCFTPQQKQQMEEDYKRLFFGV